MGKIMKILCIVPILIGMIFISEKRSFASENEISTITKEKAERSAEIYKEIVSEKAYPQWKMASFSEKKTLYDLDGKVNSYLFQLQNGDQELGYIIIKEKNNKLSVTESTREGGNPYKYVKEGEAIYAGPLKYYQRKKEKLIDLNTSKVTESLGLAGERDKKANNYSFNPSKASMVGEEIYNSRILDVPDYTWYVGCVPTAFGNIVSYWAQNGFPNLHRSKETENQLIDHLGNLMETDRGTGETTGGVLYGTWTHKIEPALQKHWKERGYTVEISWKEQLNYSSVQKELSAGRPVGLIVQNHPIYDIHSITVVGYEELVIPDLKESYHTAIVHDTWDTTPKDVYLDFEANIKYFTQYFTINPYIFNDVPKGYWAYDQIMYMAGNKIMTGYGNGYFGAQDNMTREQLAAFLYRYLKPVDTNENPYGDINDSPFKKEITALTKRGIFSVNSEKKFNPKNTATRAEIAAVLTKAFNLKVKANYEFNDMKGHWANESVKALYSNGIANGIGNKNFGPSANVTREQMAMFLYKAINLDPNYIPVPI
ncbi:S-layer protein (plasmid) [Bacillus thuringiensis HD-771]|uniref:S-layer protein n=2 Tax=Bacillus thuringiensis TaxID=1428 RepID=A0A9W3P166_BACTU|nr:S-layer homology domain-containing protein [Bacillus thuringiensis]AFQ19744.1 S-layer protein [Bacillus thuringiensis HD-771]MEC3515733.1 S-layer homology domain-containing protein [Bacillus thuringiensis]